MSMNSWNAAYPRATSNGEYGRFLFTPGCSAAVKHDEGCPSQFSSNGNRMVQHVHYPNCQNYRPTAGSSAQQQQGHGDNPSQAQGMSNGMPEYTVEYGEDAVRAALGGELPDFEAQFQKQYGSGGGAEDGYRVSPQQMEMMTNGKNSKVAMIPVVLTSEDAGDEQQTQPQDQIQSPTPATGEIPSAQQEVKQKEGQPETQKPPKPETLIKTINAVRSSRSTGPVKYGRHVRPSYWNPQAPNPCRKKQSGSEAAIAAAAVANGNNEYECGISGNQEGQQEGYAAYPAQAHHQNQKYSGMTEGYSSTSPSSPQGMPTPSHQNSQLPTATSMQKTRSFPPSKKSSNPLCGKCRKCKNLNSGNSQSSVITFPDEFSPGVRMGIAQRQKFNTSSNLGQSAKNFRAIRFSSNQHHRGMDII